ncbi:MAG: 30S ribosomal protein S20 [Anaerolineales bacterium]|nr:30S ribosomal protein S20 [Anaerolineales bacterium]
MPTIRSAAKRMRQNKKRRERNRVFRGAARTHIKQAQAAIDDKDLENARAGTLLAIKALDRAASKGVIHKNNAARRKSRLLKRLAALESGKAKTK